MITGKNFLHYDLNNYDSSVTIEVTLKYAAWVRLMDNNDYMRYLNGDRYNFYGGFVNRSPYRIKPPHLGHWHLIIDLNGQAGQVAATVNIKR